MRSLSLMLLPVLVLGASAARAEIFTPARTSVATLSFSDLKFDNAHLDIATTLTIAPGSTGTKLVAFKVASTVQSHSFSSTGDVSLTNVNFNNPNVSLDVSSSGAGGSWTINEGFNATTNLNGPGPLYRYRDRNDQFAPFVHNRLNALELFFGFQGLVDTGGSFTLDVNIPGDWSTTGGLNSITGQHVARFDRNAWSILQPFTFDAVTDTTRFAITNPNYGGVNSADPSPFLDLYLLGTSVPEPASLACLLVGGLTLVGRRAYARTAGR